METLNKFFNAHKEVLPTKSINTFKRYVNNNEDLKKCFDILKVGTTEKYFVRDEKGIFDFFGKYSSK